MKKTENKWKTDKCGRCGKQHSGYTGKLDKDGIEYVVCGITNKRMNVSLSGHIDDWAFATIWIKDN